LQSAKELSDAVLGQELAITLQQINTWLGEPEVRIHELEAEHLTLHTFGQKVKEALQDIGKEHAIDVFNIG
jgi:hypothetical protein